MNKFNIYFYLILLLILCLIILYIFIYYGNISNYYNNIKYKSFLINNHIVKNNLNKNKYIIPVTKSNRILIITYDNRPYEPYVMEHNRNISAYCNLYGYQYKFMSKYNDDINIYWKKIFIVRDELKNTLYDYIIWLDSDTIILDYAIQFNTIINSYDSDLYFIDDNIYPKEQINAGVFIIKNSPIGKTFMEKLVFKYNNSYYVNPYTKILYGIWGGPCYEQGQINIILTNNKDFKPRYTILPQNIVFCKNDITDISNLSNIYDAKTNIFIFHYYGTSNIQRYRLFYLLNKLLKI
jgi:hypothetical protein